jgi:hypothetical protein
VPRERVRRQQLPELLGDLPARGNGLQLVQRVADELREAALVGLVDPALDRDPEDGDPGLALAGAVTALLQQRAGGLEGHGHRVDRRQAGRRAGDGVRSSVVRLPPSVHGEGDHHGFVPMLVGIARDKGVSCSIGDGSNRWPAVHRLDAARLFGLALETAPAGSVLHGVADEGISVRAIAELIGRHLDLPAVAVAPEDAGEHFGWLAGFLAADVPCSSARTRELVGWQPTHLGLADDLDQGHYFQDQSA